MSKVKIESNSRSVCPYCGGQSLEYSEVQFQGDYLFFPCRCDDCGRYFEEWNRLEFVGHNVGRDGEYEAVIGEEIEYEEEN